MIGEREIGEADRIGGATPAEKRIERDGVRGRRQLLAELGGERDDPLPSLGRAKDPAKRRVAAAREVLGGDAVRRDHEVLDQLARAVLLVGSQVRQHAVLENGARFERLEAKCAAPVAHPLQRLRDAILEPEVLVETRDCGELRRRGRRSLEPRANGVVRELRAIANPGAIEVRCGYRRVGGDRHLDDDGEPVFVLGERGEVGRELLGQHREHFRGRVDRRRVGPGMAVDRRAGGDQRIDVGDGDEDRRRAIRPRLRGRELVEVARIVVVDRRPEEAAQVANRAVDPRSPGRQSRLLRRGPPAKSRAAGRARASPVLR